MRLLVTGATGLVASRIVPIARARGHVVVAQSRATHGELWRPEIVDALFAASVPDVIIHPAGLTDVDACERSPDEAYRSNMLATRNLAGAARRTGAHLIYVSTDYVFDGERGPYSENDLPNPQGVYARTKFQAELVARTFVPSCAIVRTATVMGWPPGAKNNFGAWLVKSMSSGESVRLFSDQIVSPSLASNVAEMVIDVAEARGAGVWNLCGADAVDRVSVGRKVCEVFGFDQALIQPVKMAEGALSVLRPLRAGLTVGRAARLAHPPMSLEEIVRGLRAEWRREG
ncbi:MAG: SDR family oxidoreductase [Myxococcaceae bacterium]